MFDDILKLVKDHFENHPDVAPNIPPDQADAIHNEIANHIANTVTANASGTTAIPATPGQGGLSGIISTVENAVASGGVGVSAIEGGLVSSLASKFGLPPSITGAISGALPGLLQRFMHKPQA